MSEQKNKHFLDRLNQWFGYQIKTGWAENKKGKLPRDEKNYGVWGTYAGGKVRKTQSKVGKLGAQDIVKSLQQGGRDVLYTPFRGNPSPELKRAMDHIGKYGGTNRTAYIKKAINFCKSIIMVPMIKGKYKKNSKTTVFTKGFNRATIDTGHTVKQVKTFVINKGNTISGYSKGEEIRV